MAVLKKEQLAGMGVHYKYYTVDYFLDCMVELGIKNVELLGGHQGLLG